MARLHDAHGNLIAFHQIPYSFKSVPKPDRDGVLQDDYSSIPPVVSPVATMPSAAGPSTLLNPTISTRRTGGTSSRRPAPVDYSRTIDSRHSVPQIQPPLVGGSSRTATQQQNAVEQPLLQTVAPIEGPTRGGLNIVLVGMNFPPLPTVVYVRFGSAVAVTVCQSVLLHFPVLTPPYSPG